MGWRLCSKDPPAPSPPESLHDPHPQEMGFLQQQQQPPDRPFGCFAAGQQRTKPLLRHKAAHSGQGDLTQRERGRERLCFTNLFTLGAVWVSPRAQHEPLLQVRPSEPLRDQLPEHRAAPQQTLRVPGPKGRPGQVPARRGTRAATQVSELGWTGSCSPQHCPALPQFGAGEGGEGKAAPRAAAAPASAPGVLRAPQLP